MDSEIIFGTHIKFVSDLPKPKTKVWRVLNKYDDGFLGWISWFARWRKYSFFPNRETVFEQVCLREISNFIEEQTKFHKQAKYETQPGN